MHLLEIWGEGPNDIPFYKRLKVVHARLCHVVVVRLLCLQPKGKLGLLGGGGQLQVGNPALAFWKNSMLGISEWSLGAASCVGRENNVEVQCRGQT